MIRLLAAIAISACLAGAASAQALTLQAVGNFDEPIYVTSDPGNPERLFVVERAGRVVENSGGTTSIFADIRSVIDCEAKCSGERGLLSIAVAPGFDSNGRFFLDYAEEGSGAIHVAEMTATNGTFAPASSLRNLLTIPHPEENNHNGGQLQIGPEGNLFISTGDGSDENDLHENAQNVENLLGKILRIDPDPVGVQPYTVPSGNPFVGRAGRDEVWAYGLRNPFRFSFDRLSGALLIGDVGEQSEEEVDYAPAPGLGAGANYGWNCREGFLAETVPPEGGCAAAGDFTDPIFVYPHETEGDGPSGCAIIGGFVARGPGLGDVYGRYLYGDLCTGQIRSLVPALPLAGGERSENLTVADLNSFGEDSCGRLYAVSGNGPVYRIVGPEPESCALPQQAKPLKPSFVGIRAGSRRVLRHHRVLVSVWVSPCKGRVGNPVSLWRGNHRLGTRHLDRVCSGRFRPRINHRQRFFATVRPNEGYEGATSRKLTIKVRHRRAHQP